MKAIVVAAVFLLVLVGVAWGTAAKNRGHHASGQGTADPPGRSIPFDFTFDAKGTPSHATGQARFESLLPLVGDVSCLAVRGPKAAISGKLRQDTVNGRYFLIVVEDNGPAQDPPVDAIFVETRPAPVQCKQELDQLAWPLESGNVKVK